jgi:hypothetical protein
MSPVLPTADDNDQGTVAKAVLMNGQLFQLFHNGQVNVTDWNLMGYRFLTGLLLTSLNPNPEFFLKSLGCHKWRSGQIDVRN